MFQCDCLVLTQKMCYSCLEHDRNMFRDDWSSMINQIEELINTSHFYKNLAKEFYPHVLNEVDQALSIGPSPETHHCDPQCPDCEWYNWGLSFRKRIENGEFHEIN